jgi:hypothetical protein
MHDILDLDRFPLDKPGSPEWQTLVDQCRTDLTKNGMFNLEGLMFPAIAAAAADALKNKFETESFNHARAHNIYFKDHIDGLPDDHPALIRFQTSNNTLCGDQLTDTPMMQLYEWPEFATFLAATMDKPDLFTMHDPLARLNAMSYGPAQALNWHFDRSEFTTTLLLQAPEIGGDFQYRTDLRSDDDPNYVGVARMLHGEDDEVRLLKLKPGTLNVFRGKNTPHRVTPVQGDKTRVIAVFSFYENPGVSFSEEERIGFYGRAS